MMAQRLACISLTVADLAAAEAFYANALDFARLSPPAAADPALTSLLGATSITRLMMRRGRQMLELMQFDPPGAPYPRDSHSNDLWFQHCALVTDDMAAAYRRLQTHNVTPISRHGPQTLPGGVVAFKFRDPDHHPLELIQFPTADPATAHGIDHSAISVADADRSIAFYAAALGLAVTARQVNTGPAQDALDNLDAVAVDVVALSPAIRSPHLELLAYRAPAGRRATPAHPSDIAATRLVFTASPLPAGGARLITDPDGHSLLLTDEAAGWIL
jgi:catechol 2,3-dioxygenase-like lactoylglutathione lyase family enzyme